MAISRGSMSKMISNPPNKKKVKKIIKNLKKASKSHAGQAKTLQNMIKRKKRNG
jgi:hypothetical protein